MTYLPRDQRRQLEATVKAARVQAEAGAKAALEHLAVGQRDAFAHLSDAEKALRKDLRARARQLGDVRDNTGEHGLARLIHATAYEHWHRMLFARFLAERRLLLHPEGVAVTLADCEDLAREEGARNGWELAGRYAARMLPQVFRPDDPVLRVELATEYQQQLERLLAGLDAAVFQAKDSLGWVYQFWQAQKKKDINDAEIKIGADELPAVTQLFTEPYMVQFLLHNTLGAWWAGKVLAVDEHLAKGAADEAELRSACGLPGVEWKYLRFVQEAGRWRPAAGTFAGWPSRASELKVIDPCCGSGHFLCEMLEILTALRAAEEGLAVVEACDKVLTDNLHGLELDQRCTELAAFNVAISAWSVGHVPAVRALPELKIACSGLSLGVTKAEWMKLGEGRKDLLGELDELYLQFEQAPILGSLIQPRQAIGDLFDSESDKLVVWLRKRAETERGAVDAERRELAVTAYGAATAAELLAGKYTLVATNVPYLGRGKQDEVLQAHCERHYAESRADLSTCFVDRCAAFCAFGATAVVVTPQNWLFLKGYKALRERLLRGSTWNIVARLGSKAFQTPMWDYGIALLAISAGRPQAAQTISGVDVEAADSADGKAAELPRATIQTPNQAAQRDNQDSRIQIDQGGAGSLLANIAAYGKGSTTGDGERFLLYFWELPSIAAPRVPWLDSPSSGPWSGRSLVCTTAVDAPELMIQLGCRVHGQDIWGKHGVAVNKMSKLEPFLYAGEVFDDNVGPIVPQDPANLPAFWAFVSSPEYHAEVRKVDQALKVTAGTLTKVPFDLAHWTAVAAEHYPNGLPKPYSSDPTQWLFNGHPLGADHPLQVATARLVGYRWPRQTGSSFPDCPALDPDGLETHADNDGIVCLPAVSGERPAADRLHDLLAAAYGTEWSPAVLERLLDSVGCAGRDLATWLEKSFFEQHCKLFKHRPFVWHIWDGVRGGFSALLHYHRLDHKTLENLTYRYLGDWIQRQDHAARAGQDGAQERLAAATNLQRQLELILAGEPPLDIFVRWKPLAEQPIGWQPDLDDGVRMNIRPFMLAQDVGSRGAGLLRWKPNIKWEKDRGKDVASAPWYARFQGERINDVHLTVAEKKESKE